MKTIKALLALLLLAGILGLSTAPVKADETDNGGDFDPFDNSIHQPW